MTLILFKILCVYVCACALCVCVCVCLFTPQAISEACSTKLSNNIVDDIVLMMDVIDFN